MTAKEQAEGKLAKIERIPDRLDERALAKIENAGFLPEEWNKAEWIQTLMSTIWKDVPPRACLVGMAFAGNYGLNPYLNEFFLIEGRPFVGRDGFLKVGTGDPRYVDHKLYEVHAKDGFGINDDGTIRHEVNGFADDERGRFLGAAMELWVRGDDGEVRCHPYKVELSDFKHLQKKHNWRTNPKGMCANRVIVRGFREHFPLGALYLVDEASEVLAGDMGAIEGEAIQDMDERNEALVQQLLGQEADEDEEPGGSPSGDDSGDGESPPAPAPPTDEDEPDESGEEGEEDDEAEETDDEAESGKEPEGETEGDGEGGQPDQPDPPASADTELTEEQVELERAKQAFREAWDERDTDVPSDAALKVLAQVAGAESVNNLTVVQLRNSLGHLDMLEGLMQTEQEPQDDEG